MRPAVLKAMRAVEEKTAALRSAKSESEKETAAAALTLACADLEIAMSGPSAKSTYKKKTTTVEEEEDDGDDDSDGDDDGDDYDEEEEEKAEKMPPSEDEESEEEEEESSDEEEKAAKAGVAAARKHLASAKSDRAKAVRGAALVAAKQHLKTVQHKAQRAAMRHVSKLRAEVRTLTAGLKDTAKIVASNRKLKVRLATLERAVALGAIQQPDPSEKTGSDKPSAEQEKIWKDMGMSAEEIAKAHSALTARNAFNAKITGATGARGN